jgi:general secretion pathway protein G
MPGGNCLFPTCSTAPTSVRRSSPPSRRRVDPRRGNRRGAFTLIELVSAITIIGILASIGFPKYRDAIDQAKVARAIGDLRALAADLTAVEPVPASLAAIGRGGMLDPWGRPYVYLPFPVGGGRPAGARKDRFAVPINSRFDLYSVGKDGASAVPLTARPSRDDIVVANDGGFIGLAKNF